MSLCFAFKLQVVFAAQHQEGESDIKRPMNCFMLFRQERYSQIVEKSLYKQQEISKMIAVEWKKLPEKEKSSWKTKAERLATEHKKKYPEYKYQPKRKEGKQTKKRKRSVTRKDTTSNIKKSKLSLAHHKEILEKKEKVSVIIEEELKELSDSELLNIILKDLFPKEEQGLISL